MLWPAPNLDAGFERGQWAEGAGYDDLWLPDAEGLQDPVALAAALGAVTSRVRIGTAVVPAFNRPPPVLATGVVAAEQRAPGRFVLGIGPSTGNMVTRWYGLDYARPLTRVRETVTLLRSILAGEKTRFEGRTVSSTGFTLKERPTAPVPLFLGAIGPRMLELAGEIADGVILNDFTPPDRLDWALTHLEHGTRRSGRTLADIEIVKRRAIYVADDDTGREYFRQYLAFYGSAPAYQEVMLRLGYDDAVAELRAGYAARDRARVAAAISDAMVERLSAFGDAAALRALARADFGAGINSLIVSPQGPSAADFARGAEAFAAAAFTPSTV